MQLSDF